MVPFENVNKAAPDVGGKVWLPEPAVGRPGVVATSMAAGAVGSVSVNATPVRVEAVGLESVTFRVDEPPAVVELGAKLLAIITCAGSMIEINRAEVEKSLL